MTRTSPSQPRQERPDISNTAIAWLDGLFERLELNAKVEAKENPKTLLLNITGPDSDKLGNSGRSPELNALHTILQSVLFPNERPWKQLILDINGQRGDLEEREEPEARRDSRREESNGRRTSRDDSNGRRPSRDEPNGRRTSRDDSEGRRTSRPSRDDSEGRRTSRDDSEGRRPSRDSRRDSRRTSRDDTRTDSRGDARVEQLQEFSGWLATKTVALGKPITVLGMNNVDRRAVHITLREDNSVETDSEGFGPFRRLKIKHS